MTASPTTTMSTFNRWLIVLLLMGFAAIGHFNRVGISVAGTEVFIGMKGDKTESAAATATKTPAFAQFLARDAMLTNEFDGDFDFQFRPDSIGCHGSHAKPLC